MSSACFTLPHLACLRHDQQKRIVGINNHVTSGARILWNNGLFLFSLKEVFSKSLYFYESYDWARNCKQPVGQGCSQTQIYAHEIDNFENPDWSHVVLAINRSPVSGTSICDENSLVVRIKGDSELHLVIYYILSCGPVFY
jgi:hypothetical protein